MFMFMFMLMLGTTVCFAVGATVESYQNYRTGVKKSKNTAGGI